VDRPKLDRDRVIPLAIACLVGVSIGMAACTVLDQVMARKTRALIPRPAPCDTCAERSARELRQRVAAAKIEEAKTHAAATGTWAGPPGLTVTYGNGVDSSPSGAIFSPLTPPADVDEKEEGGGGPQEG
jgi:hypothetical protein